MALPASQVGRATGKGRDVARKAVGCLRVLEGLRMLTAVTGGTLRLEGPVHSLRCLFRKKCTENIVDINVLLWEETEMLKNILRLFFCEL